MQEAQNTKVVQDAYAAFGRADIPGVLAAFSEDTIVKPITGAGSHVPMAGERRGKAALAEFFKILGGAVLFTTFEPREFVAQGDKVVALGHYTGKAIPTGKTFDSDWVMVFTLRNGQVQHFQEFMDSAAINDAFK